MRCCTWSTSEPRAQLQERKNNTAVKVCDDFCNQTPRDQTVVQAALDCVPALCAVSQEKDTKLMCSAQPLAWLRFLPQLFLRRQLSSPGKKRVCKHATTRIQWVCFRCCAKNGILLWNFTNTISDFLTSGHLVELTSALEAMVYLYSHK